MSETPASFPTRRLAVAALGLIAVGGGLWWWLGPGRAARPETAPPGGTPAFVTAPAEESSTQKSSVAARMLGSGVMRGMVATAQRNAIEQELGGILAELKFTGDQRTRLVDLLMENQAVVAEASLTRMVGGLTAAEEAQLQRRIDAANDDARAKSEAFFAREFPGDPAKFAAFQHHAALAPDRLEVAALQQRLAAVKRPLTPAQERALAEVFYEVRLGVVPALEPDDPELPGLSAADLARRIRDQQRIDTLLRNKTAAVLDPAQVAVLAEQQAERLKPFQAMIKQ